MKKLPSSAIRVGTTARDRAFYRGGTRWFCVRSHGRTRDARGQERTLPRHVTGSPQTALGLALGALAVSNVITNRVLGPKTYVPWNMAMAVGLRALARAGGVDDADLGLDRVHLRRGLTAGAVCATALAAAHAAWLKNPRALTAFDDARADDCGRGQLVWSVAVRIPLGTVALEELAFRGVLPSLVTRVTGHRSAGMAVSAALFGLWHVLPARDLHDANAAIGAAAHDLRPAVAGLMMVVSMTVAGIGLHVMRSIGAHVAAPAVVHTAVNGLGFSTAWWVRNRRRDERRS